MEVGTGRGSSVKRCEPVSAGAEIVEVDRKEGDNSNSRKNRMRGLRKYQGLEENWVATGSVATRD